MYGRFKNFKEMFVRFSVKENYIMNGSKRSSSVVRACAPPNNFILKLAGTVPAEDPV